MSLLDSYATVDDYRARIGAAGSGADAVNTAQLLSTSRLLERELGLSPGAFNSVTGVTCHFDGSGQPELTLSDRAGLCYFLQSIDAAGLGIDMDGDGVADYTFDLTNPWLRGLPENAAAGSEPYTSLELIPYPTNPIRTFGYGYNNGYGNGYGYGYGDRNGVARLLVAAVTVKGTWGWASVPEMVTELVVHLTHDLRIGQFAGPSGGLQATFGGTAHALSPNTYWLWREAQRLYSSRIPAVA